MRDALHTSHHILTAGESDAHSLMPVTLLVERLIETATLYANSLGIGYEQLKHAGIGWVLSRMSLETQRYPHINEEYALNTWITSYNRHFCDRNFDITGNEGDILGYCRSTWCAIDMRRRTMADLSVFERDTFPCLDRPCPIAAAQRPGSIPADVSPEQLHFKYSDIDFNRHVNTVRYLAHVLDHWTLQHHDNYAVQRLDMAFSRELRYGDEALLHVATSADGLASECEIIRADGARAVTMHIGWQPRH